MGIGDPVDILEAVERGIDMFDCALPTRLARHGTVWYYPVETRGDVSKKGGKINILNAKYKNDKKPIIPGCECYTCKNGFSKAYIQT